MTTTPNTLDQSGTEAADLIGDARALVAGVEKGISSAGALLALTLAATIAAMKAHLHTLATLTALLAVVAFAAVLLGVLFRLALGDPPEAPDARDEAPAGRPGNPALVVGTPATSSGATTGENRVILRK